MKFLVLLIVFIFASQAQAVAFSCKGETNTSVQVEVDSDTHPMNEEGSLYEVHTYIDSVNLGKGEVLASSIEQHKELKSGESDLLVFENKMTLKSIEDSDSCDRRVEFSQGEILAPLALCCMVE